MFCCVAQRSHEVDEDPSQQSDLTNDEHPSILPPSDIYASQVGFHPVRAMRRFRLPPAARKLFDLETNLENMSLQHDILTKQKEELLSQLDEIQDQLNSLNSQREESEKLITLEIERSQTEWKTSGLAKEGEVTLV